MCACACVRACVRECVSVCVCVRVHARVHCNRIKNKCFSVLHVFLICFKEKISILKLRLKRTVESKEEINKKSTRD